MLLISADQLFERIQLPAMTSASVFGAIPEPVIQWLVEQGEIIQAEKGEQLFTQGQAGDSFFVILEGRIRYSKYHNGRYGYIRDYQAGEQIGFMSMIALHDRVGKAEAAGPALALRIGSELYHDMHINHPMAFGILMMNLAREMARTLRDVDNLLVDKS